MSNPELKLPKTKDEALMLLIDGIQVAQKRGAYTLQESTLLYASVIKVQEIIEKKEEKIEEIKEN